MNALSLSGSSAAVYEISNGAPPWTGATEVPGELWVVGTQVVSGSVLQPQLLTDFPFDTQSAQAIIESSAWDTTVLTFQRTPTALADVLPDFPVDGWSVQGGAAAFTSRKSSHNDLSWSRAAFIVNLQRIPDLFVSRFIAPLCLIMIMMMLSPFFNPGASPALVPRTTPVFSGFGATISFMFVASNSVPQLPYSTRLDKFFMLCFFTCFIVFLFNLWMYLMAERLKKAVEDTRKNNQGRLAFCCVRRQRAEGLFTPPPPVVPEAGAVPAVVAAAAPAPAPTPGPAPRGFCNFALANFMERIDLAASCCFVVAFSVATALLLRTSNTA